MNLQNMHPPGEAGLYDPRFEHDACGVAMVARLDNRPTHEVVARAITALANLEHRGAAGADPDTGDGAGILMQMPDELFRAVAPFELPGAGRLRRAMCFLPTDDAARRTPGGAARGCRRRRGPARCSAGATSPSPRRRPGRRRAPAGRSSASCSSAAAGPCETDQDAFERKLYVIRRISELTAREPGLYVASSSSRTLVYKGMLISYQLARLLPRPARRAHQERDGAGALALLDQHLPELGARAPLPDDRPQRRDQHAAGQRQLDARARERARSRSCSARTCARCCRSSAPGDSDSATFDNVLELLMLAGRSLPHAVMMMIPEAYRDRDDLPDYLKGFYAYHSCLMEPWDGPAAIAFTDGRVIGATLDRNGLRPGRWVETPTATWCSARRRACCDIPPENVMRLGRLQPGKLFLVDLERGPDRPGRGGQARGRHAASPTASGTRATPSPSTTCRASEQVTISNRAAAPAPAGLRLHAGGPAGDAGADGDRRPRSRSARWATTSRWRCSPTRHRRCSPTSSSCSRRSPTRRSTRSARRS